VRPLFTAYVVFITLGIVLSLLAGLMHR